MSTHAGSREREQEQRIQGGWTAGPWDYQRHAGCKQVGPRLNRQRIREVACTPGLHVEREDRANARLMAAAPEMAEALDEIASNAERTVFSTSRGAMDGNEAFMLGANTAMRQMAQIARAALLKATGGTPRDEAEDTRAGIQERGGEG